MTNGNEQVAGPRGPGWISQGRSPWWATGCRVIAPAGRPINCIDGQKAHHCRVTFEAEFVELLQLHQVPCGERTHWD